MSGRLVFILLLSSLIGYCSSTRLARASSSEAEKMIEDLLDEILNDEERASRQQPQFVAQIDAGSEFYGVALLNKKIYAVNDHSSVIKVFDGETHARLADIPINGLQKGLDIVACEQTGRLYVIEKHPYNWIWSVDPASGSATKLITTSIREQGMTLSCRGDKLIVVSKHNAEFYIYDATSGQRQSTVKLPEWMMPNHAVQTASGTYILCSQAAKGRPEHDEVNEVDASGNVLQTYGGLRGSGPSQLNKPQYVAQSADGRVFAADFENRRMVGIDSTLKTGSVLLDTAQLQSRQGGDDGNPSGRPWRLAVDRAAGKLYVGIATGIIKIYRI